MLDTVRAGVEHLLKLVHHHNAMGSQGWRSARTFRVNLQDLLGGQPGTVRLGQLPQDLRLISSGQSGKGASQVLQGS